MSGQVGRRSSETSAGGGKLGRGGSEMATGGELGRGSSEVATGGGELDRGGSEAQLGDGHGRRRALPGQLGKRSSKTAEGAYGRQGGAQAHTHPKHVNASYGRAASKHADAARNGAEGTQPPGTQMK